MPDYPETNESLIVQVRDPSNWAAWLQFEQLYRPVIFRIARAKGLQHADALDLVQQVLISVSSAIDRFEKQHNPLVVDTTRVFALSLPHDTLLGGLNGHCHHDRCRRIVTLDQLNLG